ncbi:YcaO-like family protein [Rothia nasimurium]|uniref:YcaO-like family protein n=1 Tax=Rothia nasimurium TaxID=85336 RepID=UPI001624DF2F|nr:YcaO-like family protein [Rothia nasimurium]
MSEKLVYAIPAVSNNGAIEINSNGLTFLIEKDVDLIWCILKHCNGLKTAEEISNDVVSETGAQKNKVDKVIVDLVNSGIVSDSKFLYKHFMYHSDNPSIFSSDMERKSYISYEKMPGWQPNGEGYSLENVPQEASNRESCRSFSDQSISLHELAVIIRSATNRPPSAGGLYPIRISIILNRNIGNLEPGVYHYSSIKNEIIPAGRVSPEEVLFALNREDGIYNAPAVIVISGDVERQPLKYSNRGWRYTLIESGIATERILNKAEGIGLSTLIFGGYDDTALNSLLFGLNNSSMRAIICVAIGHKLNHSADDLNLDNLHNLLDDLFVGEEKLIESAGDITYISKVGDLSFHQALASIRDNKDISEKHYEGGTAASTIAARTKAIIECVERYSSSLVRIDKFGPACKINPNFDAISFLHMSLTQIDSTPSLMSFDPSFPVEWVKGNRLIDNLEFYLPIELIYYPLSSNDINRPLLTTSNSSGVASHIEKSKAIQGAFLELIERHAVLESWHKQKCPILVPEENYSNYVLNRREYWENQGYELHLFDYSMEGVLVAGVAIGSSVHFPAFAFGSSASLNWETAVNKALHEAESGISIYRKPSSKNKFSPMSVDEVVTPLDHGHFHAYDPNRTAWNFLSSSSAPIDYSIPASVNDIDSAIHLFEPISFQIDSPDPIVTYRVVSPKLFPISFGAKWEFRPDWSVAPKIPHFIA